MATRTSRTLGCEVKVFFTVDNNDNEDNEVTEELGMKITVTSVTPPEAELYQKVLMDSHKRVSFALNRFFVNGEGAFNMQTMFKLYEVV